MPVVWIVLVVILLCCMSGLAAAAWKAFRWLLYRREQLPEPPNPARAVNETERIGLEWILAESQRLGTRPHEEVEIQSEDGVLLHGYFFRAPQPTTDTVLAVHGYRSHSFYEYPHFAAMYLEQLQFNVLIVDDRAHGKSGGTYVGLGWLDRRDVVCWVKWLVHKMGGGCRILLQGCSMGAATVLMAGAQPDLPAQVRAIVADCGFAAVRDTAKRLFHKHLHLPMFPLYHMVSLWSRLCAGYWIGQSNAGMLCKAIRVPTLIVHGTADKLIAPANAQVIYDALTAPKTLLYVEGAGHGQSILYDRQAYSEAVQMLWKKGESHNENIQA